MSPAGETTPPPPVAMSAETATAAKLAGPAASSSAAAGDAAADADAEGAAYGAVLPQTGAVAGTAPDCWRWIQHILISLLGQSCLALRDVHNV